METLKQLSRAREFKGPSPAFTAIQLIYAVILIGSSAVMGRKRLTSQLGLGEGTVRTMLARLVSWELAFSTREGLRLTQKGVDLYQFLTKTITELKRVEFEMPWTAPHNYGVVVKDAADRVSTGVEERDEAVRNGASAAMVLTYLADGLHMPRVSNLSVERPDFAEKVIKFFTPSENDVILITGADDEAKARYSALAAAVKLVVGKA
ncbi:MAG: hypothetical protein NZ570_06410 [Candidatus Caldarchaeum sp.]|nr:hypothetical protein [Candidatus Caldarchaeum sp.]MDW8359787.1 DUF4443 domain-containing protein [Candidatus Caldarchaeum sp.]